MTDRQTDRQTDRRYDLDILKDYINNSGSYRHASYYTIKTKFGGIQYDQLMQDMMVGDTTFHRVATYLTDWIYVFHMPAYFCLSGVVFSMELKRKRYPSVLYVYLLKAKRLLAPMLFVWLVWNIPIKMLAGYYAGMNHPITERSDANCIP